jgi:type VI secretion system protein ImpF
MARIRDDQPLIPSVLDRLIDDEPEKSQEAPRNRAQVLRDMKASVQRDLENLLNTRWRASSPPEDLPLLQTSLANYGIPDFNAAFTGSVEDRERLRHTIEQVIRRFETRFKSVRVALLTNSDPSDRRLRLRIDAVLFAEPAPEPVVFDTQLEPILGSFSILRES